MRNILKGFLESRAETYILPEAGEIHFEEGISEFIPPSLDEEALSQAMRALTRLTEGRRLVGIISHVAELKEKGDVEIRRIPLKPLRDMRRIRGTYMEVTDRSFYQDTNTEDYVQITLTDEEDVPDGLQKLRVIYPNLMRLEYDNRRIRESGDVNGACEVEQKSELELFGEFYELQNNQAMSEKQEAFVRELIRKVQERG